MSSEDTQEMLDRWFEFFKKNSVPTECSICGHDRWKGSVYLTLLEMTCRKCGFKRLHSMDIGGPKSAGASLV